MKGTIKSKKDIERLFSIGRRSSSYAFTILQLEREDEEGRCAFIAGKKLGSAPMRNRCKRVMRHVAYDLGCPWKGNDVVFIARRKVATENHDKLVKKARTQLDELGIFS